MKIKQRSSLFTKSIGFYFIFNIFQLPSLLHRAQEITLNRKVERTNVQLSDNVSLFINRSGVGDDMHQIDFDEIIQILVDVGQKRFK